MMSFNGFSKSKRYQFAALLAALAVFVFVGAAIAAKAPVLRMATTTSTHDVGRAGPSPRFRGARRQCGTEDPRDGAACEAQWRGNATEWQRSFDRC